MSETKSAEQVAAEQKLEAELKQAQETAAKEAAAAAANKKAAADKAAAEKKAAADKAAARLEAKKKKAGEVHFVHEGEVYVPQMPKVQIPGLGTRTALEICADEEAQAWLISEGCVGSVLRKV